MSSSIPFRVSVGLVVAAFVGGLYLAVRPLQSLDGAGATVVGETDAAIGVTSANLANEPSGGGDMVRDVVALRGEVALLRSELAALAKAFGEFQAEQATYPAAPVRPEDGHWMDPGDNTDEMAAKAQEEAVAQHNELRSRERMRTYEAGLQSEPVDGEWSALAVQRIEDELAAEELSSTLVGDVECRTTVCRVNVSHADFDLRRAFERTFVERIAELLPRAAMHTEEHPDGSSSSTIYLAREGYRLPRVEPRDAW